MRTIVSSATPIMAFAKIDQLALLRRIVGVLAIAPAIDQEIREYTDHNPRPVNLDHEDWVTCTTLNSDHQVKLLLPTLDRGEAETIALAIEQQADLVLTDELTSRKVAESLNMRIVSSAGILIRAKQLREIAAVKPFLDAMQQQGLYFNQQFANAVLRVVGEA